MDNNNQYWGSPCQQTCLIWEICEPGTYRNRTGSCHFEQGQNIVTYIAEEGSKLGQKYTPCRYKVKKQLNRFLYTRPSIILLCELFWR